MGYEFRETHMTLIKGGGLFCPEDRGVGDILLGGGIILKTGPEIDLPKALRVDIYNASGKYVVPGFIDQHVHIQGAGGEGGPTTRTPEIPIEEILLAGVTTVVGVLGVDPVTRTMEGLLAKAYSLEEAGITTYVYTGSYRVPTHTLTGSIQKDLALIPKVIGVKVALSDHRSSQPTFEEFARIVSEARVGGMLGKKAGIVHVHMGAGGRGMEYLFRLIKETEIPITQVIPTHVARTEALLEEATEYARQGGTVDITATEPGLGWWTTAPEALQKLLREGVPLEQITISSDSNGSMPVFDEEGHLVGMAIGRIANLFQDFKSLAQSRALTLPQALMPFTINPAMALKIENKKGSIEEGMDADILVLREDLSIERLYARGRPMVIDGRPA